LIDLLSGSSSKLLNFYVNRKQQYQEPINKKSFWNGHPGRIQQKNNLDIRLNRKQTPARIRHRKIKILRKFIHEASSKGNRKCPDIMFKEGMLQNGKEYKNNMGFFLVRQH
ncbi:hypothetical protein ANCDUO_10790, partial [Ancylostoma duodenale]